MLALLPEHGVMLAKRVKALKTLRGAVTAPEVQRPPTLLCVWDDAGTSERIRELCVWGFPLLLSHRSLGRGTEPLEQRL